MTKFVVNRNDEGQTIFNFIKKNFKSTSLSVIYKWFRTGKIKVNDKKIKDQKHKISLDDVVKVFDSETSVKRQKEVSVAYDDLKIIYEDDNLIIVDKPSNLEMHSPININLDDMVRSYLIASGGYDISNENSFVISHVHRLDKLTRGLVIYAKNKVTLNSLLEAIKNKERIKKFYLARLENQKAKIGTIHGFIKYDESKKRGFFNEIRQSYAKECMQLQRWHNKSMNIIEIQLITGRKHQIRSVMNYFDSPIVGDYKYGANKTELRQIELIAYKLIFRNFIDHLSYLNEAIFESKYHF